MATDLQKVGEMVLMRDEFFQHGFGIRAGGRQRVFRGFHFFHRLLACSGFHEVAEIISQPSRTKIFFRARVVKMQFLFYLRDIMPGIYIEVFEHLRDAPARGPGGIFKFRHR